MKSFAEIKKERTVNTKIIIFSLIACILVSFIFYITMKSVKKPFATPSLFSFMLFFMLAGVTYITIASLKKDFFIYIAGSLSLVLGTILLLTLFKAIKWYVIVASAVVMLLIAFLLLLAFGASKTVFVADNEGSEYKDYKQRRAEKPVEEKKEEELPELKSFK